jgi:hypothetical protein
MPDDRADDYDRADRHYRADLARIHHEGFAFHADACAPGIVALLERASDGPDHFARVQTTFVEEPDGRYRRGFERHDNVLVDVRRVVPPLLAAEGLTEVTVALSFGTETNMVGLMVVVARRPT